ncbi:NAD(P)/FAD-dependent oxidoreductase [Serratia rubidaea]|uniref:Gamma-glutamylputrescine oxidoreductase n=1 Tax=Serratia rubidaea TaxID=61652 RepID=A0A448SMS7_SERRU|nr:FAD-dependent oxidoreductase [Serratia rubidaea]MDC6118616.1 FAD-dependent oxidoreductase [Serratia rubidaea]MEB7587195.1 FAD-binding oxidoreductase [Serratia rubidaea]VEI68990.1 Gamma-glutamylputrescine oxidoreductase [Serratia rubidaea]
MMQNDGLQALLAAPSWWQLQSSQTAAPAASLPADSDLVVVGGGITGLSAALSALEHGFSATLLESAALGSGASGRNSGFVVPVPGRHSPASLRRHLGSLAQPYLARLAQSARTLLAFPGAQGENAGWMLPCGTEDKPDAEARARDWTAYGIQADYLDAEQLAERLGTSRYRYALNFRQGGQLDPLALAQSMAAACRNLGGGVVTHCPALSFRRAERGGYRVLTPQGEIVARRLLVAGNCYGEGPCRPPGAVMTLILGVFALSPDAAARCLPQGIPFSDGYKDMWFFRRLAGNRLMTGLFALPGQSGTTDCERLLRQRIHHTFGTASGALLQMWAGRIGLTRHALPHLHCPDEALAYWHGCNGRGLALSHALGSNLALRLLRDEAPVLPASRAWPQPAGDAMRWMAQLLVARDRRRRTVSLAKH